MNWQVVCTVTCAVICAVICAGVLPAAPSKAAEGSPTPIPVIFDTDLGDDIDDTWALIMLLRSPQLDVKLITTTCGASTARDRLLAKLLTVAGRDDIPIGLGPGAGGSTRQDKWVGDFKIDDYKGKVHADGAQAIIDTIHASKTPVTVIAVGPLQTLAAALKKDPAIAKKAHFVGMHGSVYRGYGGSKKPSAEYNVRRDARACQRVLSAPWIKSTITPLDTCGVIRLHGDRFAKLKTNDDPLLKALIANYAIWAKKKAAQLDRSSVLFDTVAIYLAYPDAKQELCEMKQLPIKVTDKGHTRVDPSGTKTRVAVAWKDLDAFHDLLVEVLSAK